MATAIVLGTAQDGGNPQLGSEGRGPARLVASLGVIGDDGRALLIDATPDVRAQAALLAQHPGYQPSAIGNVVDHVALTHAHMGHYAGLLHFGKEAHNADGVTCWTTQRMRDYLAANEPWATLFGDGHLVAAVNAEFQPVAGVSVRLVPVPHRPDFTDAVGYSVNERVLYIPDIDGWEQWPEAEMEIGRHDVALLDATFFSADELAGRDISQIPHPLVTDTVDRFGHLDTRIILTHLNHTNPLGDASSPEAAFVRDHGMEVASDGLTVDC